MFEQWDDGMDSKQDYTIRRVCNGVVSHAEGITDVGTVGLWLGW